METGRISKAQGSASDADLLRSCARGEQAAWDALVDRYQRLVYAVPRRAGLNEDEAKDVFQDVFLTLFQKIAELEKPELVRAWLVTTAKFKTWAVIRSRRGAFAPATEEEMDHEMANLPDGAPLADEALVELEQQHLIRSGMERLGEPCRQILQMLYLSEPAASYAQVAAAIGAAATGISPMRARCLKKLEKLIVT